ncbi:MAG: ABC transporter transmembrane domain-containing protein, partial [Pikeienuella sp.]
MFRFFENLVDPYQPYDENAPTPTQLGPFLRTMLRPFNRVALLIIFFVGLGALIDVWLIYYAGRVVNLLAETSPGEVFRTHGWELAAIAAFVLFLRPIILLVDLSFVNQSLMPNIGTMVRWRSHRKVLRQSIGWFEEDFAGRIANRVMQTAPAVGEASFQVFDALIYASIYIFGAFFLLAEVDLLLMLPLAIWLVVYILMVRFFIPRIGKASEAFSNARSQITGRIVDSYTNVQTV